MNSRISAGSTVVDCCLCQLNSPLRNLGRKTVKNRQLNHSARLTICEPYQRPRLSDGGQEARRLKQKRDAAVRCSAWLGRLCLCSLNLIAPSPTLLHDETLVSTG